METAELIWQNGEFVPWEDAKVHVLSHALHYGTGVFEGVRCYETERGPAIFRHADHLDRLAKSAELYYLELPYSTEEIARGNSRAGQPQRPRAPATSGRSPSAATATWASTRPTPRST